MSIQVTESPIKDSYSVAGRSELQLGILIVCEVFKLLISHPRAQVLFKTIKALMLIIIC